MRILKKLVLSVLTITIIILILAVSNYLHQIYSLFLLAIEGVRLLALIFTLIMLYYTVKLYNLSKVETECLQQGTRINPSQNELQLNIRNLSQTTKATLRAQLIINGKTPKVKMWRLNDVYKLLNDTLKEEDVIRKYVYLYPQFPRERGAGFLPWRVEIDPLDFRKFSVDGFPDHAKAAKMNEIKAQEIILSRLNMKKSAKEIAQLRRKGNWKKYRETIDEIREENEEYESLLRNFKNITGIALSWENRFPNLLKSVGVEEKTMTQITVRIEQTEEDYQFKKSNSTWNLPSCSNM